MMPLHLHVNQKSVYDMMIWKTFNSLMLMATFHPSGGLEKKTDLICSIRFGILMISTDDEAFKEFQCIRLLYHRSFL